MGCVFAKREFVKRGMIPGSVEAFVSLESGKNGLVLNYATYESAVQSLAHVNDLRALRRQVRYNYSFQFSPIYPRCHPQKLKLLVSSN